MSDQLRIRFEELMRSEGAGGYLRQDSNGEYLDRDTALAWHWFTKSRSVLVVELPDEWDVGATGPQMVMDADEVRGAIEAAGVTVRG